MNKKPHEPLRRCSTAIIALAALVLLAPASQADYTDVEDVENLGLSGSYGYVRNLDGEGTLFEAGTEDRSEAEINLPVLVGDRLWVAPESRAELVLSDGNLLRLGADSEVAFDALAGSPDSEDAATVLTLLAGEAVLEVVPETLGESYPTVNTPNATVYIQETGTYRISADRVEWTEVVVREGHAEVLTDRGSLIVRAGEEAEVNGDSLPRTTIRLASRESHLERWADRLRRDAYANNDNYLDDSLRYSGSSLSRHGDWIHVGARRAWRPRVVHDWRPYYHGRWRYTPAGWAWVSHEAWGWVPYHYGSWDYAPSYGWVWYPGRVFSPAWVYWRWGARSVSWCPVGYYSRHYYPRYGHGLRYGVYGYAGGDVNIYAHWNFLETRHLRQRRHARHVRSGRAYAREHGLRSIPRGVLTTDTRGLSRTVIAKPDAGLDVLRERGIRQTRGELQDVSRFVARGDLGESARRAVIATKPARLAKPTPLRPDGQADIPVRGVRTKPGAAQGGTLARKPGRVGSTGRTVATKPGRLNTPSEGRASAKPGERGQGRAEVLKRPATKPSTVAGSASGGRTVKRPANAGTLTRRPQAGSSVGRGRTSTTTSDGVRIDRRPATKPSRGTESRGTRSRRPATSKPARGTESSGSVSRRPATKPSRGTESSGSLSRRPATTSGSRPSTTNRRPTVTKRPSSSTSSGGSGRELSRRPGRSTAPSRDGATRQPPKVSPPVKRPQSSMRGPQTSRPSTRPSTARPGRSGSGGVRSGSTTVRRPAPARPSTSRPSSRPSSSGRGVSSGSSQVRRPASRPTSRPSTSRPSSGSRGRSPAASSGSRGSKGGRSATGKSSSGGSSRGRSTATRSGSGGGRKPASRGRGGGGKGKDGGF